MSNSYFQFKEFRVDQAHCAMKVSTDACIHGAWTPVSSAVKSILDIGAGTGLLSLMLAQRCPQAVIDAIEIDPEAAQQAQENFAASSWSQRLLVMTGDARNIQLPHAYDLIICNPPFFSNSLLGDKASRNQARHTLSLSFSELFQLLTNNLAPDGYASVLLPATEHQHWAKLLHSHNWHILHQLDIVPRVGQPPNRVVSLCAPEPRMPQQEALIIRDHAGQYTPEFVHLLKPFYLNL
jgi:tRNA1Val (adenine37-N6)-methyltransferase